MIDLSYKGYQGTAVVEEGYIWGEILHIRDMVTYEAHTPEELKKAFEQAVEGYLASCAKFGKEPDKTYSGQFRVRMEPDLHRALAAKAKQPGKSLNELAVESIRHAVEV